MSDEFNDTIFRADSLATEQENNDEHENVPVRASITMKKPSVDFNAEKTPSHPREESKKQKKGAGKMLWSMAASLRNMMTKKLMGNNSSERSHSNHQSIDETD